MTEQEHLRKAEIQVCWNEWPCSISRAKDNRKNRTNFIYINHRAFLGVRNSNLFKFRAMLLLQGEVIAKYHMANFNQTCLKNIQTCSKEGLRFLHGIIIAKYQNNTDVILLFSLWKYQKCYYHSMKITSNIAMLRHVLHALSKIWKKAI